MINVITYTCGSIPITADWHDPSTPSCPIVVVAYGTEGMNPPFDQLINDYCTGLLQSGFGVLRPDFFQATLTTPGMQGVFMSGPHDRFDTWVDAIVDAAKYGSKIPKSNGKLGFVGFSLGANLVLQAASKALPKPDALVDFFGPITSISQSPFSSTLTASLPPVQIHHGDQDGIVKFSESTELESWLNSAGKTCEFNKLVYSGSGHPGRKAARMKLPELPNADWDQGSQKTSLASSITFLKKYL